MYLVIISYTYEEETYFFKTKKEMFKFFEVNSINELLNLSNTSYFCIRSYTVYKISHYWES